MLKTESKDDIEVYGNIGSHHPGGMEREKTSALGISTPKDHAEEEKIIKMTEKEWSDESGVSEVKRRKTFLE